MLEAETQQPVAQQIPASVLGSFAIAANDQGEIRFGQIIERLDDSTFTAIHLNPDTGEYGSLFFIEKAALVDPNRTVLFLHKELFIKEATGFVERAAAAKPAAPDNEFGCRPNLRSAE